MKKLNNKERILVTGGAGFIGSILCTLIKLKYKNKRVIVIDNLSSGKKKYINCDEFYNFDLRNKKKLFFFFKKNNISDVIHLAGYTNLRDKSYKRFYENNYQTTKNLVDNIIKFKIKRLVFASTASVYGNPKRIPIKEMSELNPISFYGKSKLMSEKYINKKSKKNFKSIILRFFNASGANVPAKLGEDKNPPEHLIPIIMRNFLSNKKFYIFDSFDTPDGTGIRDYIHVNDICEAIIKSLIYLKKTKSNNSFFNLGSEVGTSSLVIAKKIERIAGEKIHYSFKTKKKGEPNKLLASSKKAKKLLNWRAKNTINKILKDSIFWEKLLM
tara:strand:- start:5933 stop:6916 length:984 start_codon:yes stop_codon:yes gene_type:complete